VTTHAGVWAVTGDAGINQMYVNGFMTPGTTYGKVVKHDHKLVGVDLAAAKAAIESAISFLKSEHGPAEWQGGMHPEIPEHETLNNPYTYRDDVSAWKESE
jgi:hypothetical protein